MAAPGASYQSRDTSAGPMGPEVVVGGLAGLVHFRSEAPAPDLVQRMVERLAHRGPDSAGAFSEGPAAFAHRQRRITPGARPQPCVTPGFVVMLDGWIYEHRALGDELGGPPGATDTEVVALAWARWGLDTLPRLEGEFALAVWDRARRRLVLARDRLGVRPMFYATQTDHFGFASELGALLPLPWVSRDLDRTRLSEYLSFQVVHAPRTLLRDVHQVEPGGLVEVDVDTLRSRRWWRLRYAAPDAPEPPQGDVVDALQAAVDRAVQKRVPPGVAAGLYLSGGLGSAAIAAAARSHHLALPGFTVAFADDEFPEAPFAGRVARLLGLEHEMVTVGSAELADSFDEVVQALGHPVGHPGSLLQLALARVASRKVRVVLSGDGGEELFGGRMLDALDALPVPSRLASFLPPRLRRRLPGGRVTTAQVLEAGIGGWDLFSTEDRNLLLRDHALVRPQIRTEVLAPFYEGLDTDPVNLALHGFLRSSLVEGALTRSDRTGCWSGLDVRMPLLDREVVEAAAALPGRVKQVRVGGTLHVRWPLKGVLQGVLPPTLLDRPKRGLPTPLGAWLAGPGRLFLEDRIRRLLRDPHGLWRPDQVEVLRRDATRSNAAGNKLWSLFLLDAWLEGLQRP